MSVRVEVHHPCGVATQVHQLNLIALRQLYARSHILGTTLRILVAVQRSIYHFLAVDFQAVRTVLTVTWDVTAAALTGTDIDQVTHFHTQLDIEVILTVCHAGQLTGRSAALELRILAVRVDINHPCGIATLVDEFNLVAVLQLHARSLVLYTALRIRVTELRRIYYFGPIDLQTVRSVCTIRCVQPACAQRHAYKCKNPVLHIVLFNG